MDVKNYSIHLFRVLGFWGGLMRPISAGAQGTQKCVMTKRLRVLCRRASVDETVGRNRRFLNHVHVGGANAAPHGSSPNPFFGGDRIESIHSCQEQDISFFALAAGKQIGSSLG